MKANVRGVDYTLVYDPENKEYPYLFVETKFYFKQKVNGLVALLKLITGVAIKSMV